VVPRFATLRSDRPTYGHEVALVGRAVGLELTPTQQEVVDVLLEVDADGALHYGTAVLSMPRRGGKSELLNVLALWRALKWRGQQCYATAQSGGDASWAWSEFASRVAGSSLGSAVRIRRGLGTQSIEVIATGSIIRPFAPMPDALHGRNVDQAVLDEAWALDEIRAAELLAGLVPAMATRTSPQLVLASAAGTASSTFWASWVERGKLDPGVALFDYGVPEGEDADDLDVVARHHPAVGLTVPRAALVAARSRLSPGEFRRAFANVPTLTTDVVIPAAAWEGAGTTITFPTGVRYAVGLDVDPERESAAVAVAARVDGRVLVEVLHAQRGVEWIGPVVQRLADAEDGSGGYDTALIAVVGDDAGPARATLDELVRGGMDTLTAARTWGVLRRLTAGEWASACAATYDLIVAGNLQHRRQAVLDEAVAAVARRPLGDGGWAWFRRKSGGPIAALCALTAAVAGVLDDEPAVDGADG